MASSFEELLLLVWREGLADWMVALEVTTPWPYDGKETQRVHHVYASPDETAFWSRNRCSVEEILAREGIRELREKRTRSFTFNWRLRVALLSISRTNKVLKSTGRSIIPGGTEHPRASSSVGSKAVLILANVENWIHMLSEAMRNNLIGYSWQPEENFLTKKRFNNLIICANLITKSQWDCV